MRDTETNTPNAASDSDGDTDDTADDRRDPPPAEHRELDMRMDTPDLDQTPAGTALPEDIHDEEIRAAVEEAQQKVEQQQHQHQQQHQPDTDAGQEPAQEPADTAPPGGMELPNLADEPMDREEFFADELGDPERAHKEAQAAGLDFTPRVNLDGPDADADADASTTTDTETETPMSENNPTDDREPTRERAQNTQSDDDIRAEQQLRIQQGRDQPQDDADVEQGTEEHVPQGRAPSGHDSDDQRDGPPAPDAQSRGNAQDTPAPEQRGDTDVPADDAAEHPRRNERVETGEAAPDPTPGQDQRVEQLDESRMDPNPDPDAGAATSAEMPNPSEIDFEGQDIEGASEDRGDQMVEFNSVYFVLSDLDDARAEQLLNDIQTAAAPEQGGEGERGDQFYIIIDAVVTKPSNAAERTQRWKYLHRATLAGRCMEHCGLDDIVDFQSAPGDTPGQPQAR